MKVGIDMGATSAGTAATLDLEELLATRLLVQGNSGSGKSHLLRRLLEQSAPWVQQMRHRPGRRFRHAGRQVRPCRGRRARAEAELDPHRRAHPPASRLGRAQPRRPRCRAADARRRGLPRRPVRCRARLLVSRSWWWSTRRSCSRRPWPAKSRTRRRKLSLGAMTNLMCRGRKRGLAGVIATQRLAKLAKNVAAEASNFLMGRTFLDIDMARAADLLGMDRRQAEMFRDLGARPFRGARPGAVAPAAAHHHRHGRDRGRARRARS